MSKKTLIAAILALAAVIAFTEHSDAQKEAAGAAPPSVGRAEG